MPAIVNIQDDFLLDGIRVYIGYRRFSTDPPNYDQLYFAGNERELRAIDNAVSSDPTIRLTSDEAHALYDSLGRHFHGHEDTRALRADYDLERERCDHLIATISVIAESVAKRAPS